MKKIDHTLIAPLLRGLWLDASGLPQVVIPGEIIPADLPEEIFKVDLSSAFTEEGLKEESAAKLLIEACASWNFERAPAGAEAVLGKGEDLRIPSCALVTIGDEKALYWVDEDLRSAQHRASSGGNVLRKLSRPEAPTPDSGLSSAPRSRVCKGKTALVTGGAQGFGAEIVRGLIASGALVYIADLNLPGAEKLAAELNTAQGCTVAIPVACNVADEGSVEAMFRTVAATSGGLDLCVSNAGVLLAGSVLEQDVSDFKFVTDINYIGFFIVAKQCGRLLRRQHRTAQNWKTDIIQINSKSGLEGSNKNGAYAGGKYGGIGLTASFALELVEYNIKVNAICPGNFFDGPLWSDPEKGLFVQYLNTGKVKGARTIEDVRSYYEAKVPMKRGCTGADVMRAIYYIMEQEYETGQAVPVTGGQIMLH